MKNILICTTNKNTLIDIKNIVNNNQSLNLVDELQHDTLVVLDTFNIKFKYLKIRNSFIINYDTSIVFHTDANPNFITYTVCDHIKNKSNRYSTRYLKDFDGQSHKFYRKIHVDNFLLDTKFDNYAFCSLLNHMLKFNRKRNVKIMTPYNFKKLYNGLNNITNETALKLLQSKQLANYKLLDKLLDRNSVLNAKLMQYILYFKSYLKDYHLLKILKKIVKDFSISKHDCGLIDTYNSSLHDTYSLLNKIRYHNFDNDNGFTFAVKTIGMKNIHPNMSEIIDKLNELKKLINEA